MSYWSARAEGPGGGGGVELALCGSSPHVLRIWFRSLCVSSAVSLGCSRLGSQLSRLHACKSAVERAILNSVGVKACLSFVLLSVGDLPRPVACAARLAHTGCLAKPEPESNPTDALFLWLFLRRKSSCWLSWRSRPRRNAGRRRCGRCGRCGLAAHHQPADGERLKVPIARLPAVPPALD